MPRCCSSPSCVQGAGGRSRPPRTLRSGCGCTEPAPVGAQLGWLHSPPSTLHLIAGQPCSRAGPCPAGMRAEPGELMGATCRGWLGSCAPARQSPWPEAAPESQKSERKEAIKARGRQREGTLFLSRLKEQWTFPSGQRVPLPGPPSKPRWNARLPGGEQGVSWGCALPPLVICGLELVQRDYRGLRTAASGIQITQRNGRETWKSVLHSTSASTSSQDHICVLISGFL